MREHMVAFIVAVQSQILHKTVSDNGKANLLKLSDDALMFMYNGSIIANMVGVLSLDELKDLKDKTAQAAQKNLGEILKS